MLMGEDSEVLFDRRLSLMAECIEKLLKQVILERTHKLPDSIHAHRKLLSILTDTLNLTSLKKYKSICSEFTNIYYTRRYPSANYFEIDREDYNEIYSEGLELIKVLVNLLEDKGLFENEFRQSNKTTKLDFNNM